MKLFKSTGSYQQAYNSKYNDVTAYHSSFKDICLIDYASALVFKMPLLVKDRICYRLIRRFFDKGMSRDLSKSTMYEMIVSTGLSRYVRNNILDLKYFENIGMNTAIIELDHQQKMAIPLPQPGETSNQTMDRAQRACFLAVPIHYHSFVHFHAPTAMAIYSNMISNGKLKTLLKRHTRYTLVYNNGGISASSSDFFCNTLLPDYSNKRASDSILSRVQQYWNITKHLTPSLPPAREIANSDNFTMNWQPDLSDGLAFERKIMSFYPYIRSYVQSHNLTADELLNFSRWFSENIYPIPESIQATEIPLTYLIWSNSVVHSLEHAEYYKWKAYARYGPKTDNDAWYRYFMNVYAKPYGALFRNEKLHKHIPEIKDLDGADDSYVSIQF